MSTMPQDDDLAVLLQVDGVDEASFHNPHSLYLGKLWPHATHLHIAQVTVAPAGHQSRVLKNRHSRLHLRAEMAACHVHVTLIELYVASLLHAVVGHGGASAKHMDGVEREVTRIPLKGVYDSVASPLQHNDQEESAGHGKACGCRAQLVHAYVVQHLAHGVGHGPLDILPTPHTRLTSSVR